MTETRGGKLGRGVRGTRVKVMRVDGIDTASETLTLVGMDKVTKECRGGTARGQWMDEEWDRVRRRFLEEC